MRVLLLSLVWSILTGSLNAQEPKQSPDAQALAARFRKEKSPLWTDGNQLTAYYEGEAESVQLMIGGLPKPLVRIEGTRVWHWTGQFADLDKGILSYSWNIKPAPNSSQPEPQVWRGPNAPTGMTLAKQLRGKLTKHKMRSEILGTDRDITVYLPPQSTSPTHVVYAADGEDCVHYASAIEPLMIAGKLPATAIIGVHCGGYEGGPLKDLSKYNPSKDLRAIEYLPMLDSGRFEKHAKFFAEEVPKWAESNFGISARREHRAVFGVSNGGRFAATIGVERPEVFGVTIAFSLAVGTPPESEVLTNLTSKFFLCAGTWEDKFLARTEEFHAALKKSGVPSDFVQRVSGHDLIMWQEEFAHALRNAFTK